LASYRWGKKADNIEEDQVDEPIQKPDFGLSGALAKDNVTGNIQNGIVMKWSEPPEARIPDKRWRLYVFKDGRNIGKLITWEIKAIATNYIYRNITYPQKECISCRQR
jgi:hypothetical protein